MADTAVPPEGDHIDTAALVVPKAKAVVRFLLAADYPYAKFIEARRLSDGKENVVFDLVVEVGQEPVNDIRAVERISAIFDPKDSFYPEVLALRTDFPKVPHRNLRAVTPPSSLCLYDEPYRDVQLRWTAAAFIQRIRDWLALTAEGKLHADDQPLEPILLGKFNTIVLPSDLSSLKETATPVHLYITARDPGPRGTVLMATRERTSQSLDLVAVTVNGQPQPHGIIQQAPRTLFDLHNLLAAAGIDLMAQLQASLMDWERDAALLDARFVVIAFLPKTRKVGGEPESLEIRSFASPAAVAQLGVDIGIWSMNGKYPGRLIPKDDSKRGENVPVEVLNTVFGLSRDMAACLNGLSASDTRRVTAVGVGALGSQVVTNLVKAGFGTWTLIDDDYLLPHNAARHQLPASAIGLPKATSMQVVTNDVLEVPAVTEAIVANILEPGDKADSVQKALREVGLIADFSADVAVSRHLARDLDVPGRRLSLFLNPSGTDLVLLVEDEDRKIRLDHLEMQYYREVLRRPNLNQHMMARPGRIRYAQSCRDLTSSVPQHSVALHAAIGSRAFRDAAADKTARIRIWSTAEDLSVSAIDVEPVRVTTLPFGAWELCVDTVLLDTIRELRSAKLPNETGGILIGAFDQQRRVVYVVDTVPSPPDSQEWPTLYIRGSQGLQAQVESIRQKTQGMLEYVGEWHSHPDGFSAKPSNDDKKVFAWLTTWMALDDAPALMAIVSENEFAWFLGLMT